MLDTQYRMHPGISRFPSSEFYNLLLRDGTVNDSGQVTPTLLPPVSAHLNMNPETGHRPSVIFIDHQGPEVMKSRSRVNWTEGYIACNIVEDLLLNNPVSWSPILVSEFHTDNRYAGTPRGEHRRHRSL